MRPVDEPTSREEAQMDVLDFVNLRVFGNARFRQQQRAVVETVVEGMDAFVLMPTGGGEPTVLLACQINNSCIGASPCIAILQASGMHHRGE